jgi:leader peptidase (prepilin peptidase) / N-methyltransferase
MSREQLLNGLLHVIVFMLGAGIGSFLNVVIYRLPLGISVNNPKRSFCPHCKKQIPAWRNIPLFSWLLLRGKCADCGAPIPFRYFFVELLTAVLFYVEFRVFGGSWEHLSAWGPALLIYWIFTALLIAGTFIDFDHFILPHEITLTGLAVGLLGSYWAPQIVGETEHGRGILVSFISACIALGLLWAVVELGKLAFGRLKETFEIPKPWSISQPDEAQPPVFKCGDTELGWGDIFTRASDRLIIQCSALTVNDRSFTDLTTEIKMTTMKVTTASGVETFDLEKVTKLEGSAREIVIPREAMGFGDVLLLAMIGAFLGWKAVLFVIVAASVLGTLCAVLPRLIGKTDWGARIPFGPYLACAALIWLFYGAQIFDWYLARVHWRA